MQPTGHGVFLGMQALHKRQQSLCLFPFQPPAHLARILYGVVGLGYMVVLLGPPLLSTRSPYGVQW